MGNVVSNLSMSLDGCIAGPQDNVEQVFKWYSSGDTAYHMPGTEMVVHVSPASAALLQEAHRTTGALVTGRWTFDIAQAWGVNLPWAYHVLSSPIRSRNNGFMRDRPSPSSRTASKAPSHRQKRFQGTRTSPTATQASCSSASKAGLLDEIHIDLVPVLLGAGIRLFDNLGTAPIELEITRVVEGVGVTHLKYQVVK